MVMVMVNSRALPLMLLPCCRQNAFFSIDIQEIFCHCTYVLKDPFPKCRSSPIAPRLIMLLCCHHIKTLQQRSCEPFLMELSPL